MSELHYPTCGDWSCDQDSDWRLASPGDPAYSGAKKERGVMYHVRPRAKADNVLREYRRKNGGLPLWMKP